MSDDDELPIFDLPKFFRDSPRRPTTEKENRQAVDVLWDSIGHKSGEDEMLWKERHYAVMTGETTDEELIDDYMEKTIGKMKKALGK